MPFSASPFWQFHFSLFFPIWAKSCFANLKAACYHSFFLCFFVLVPRGFFLSVPWEVARFYWCLCSFPFVLIFFFCLFLSSYPILPLTLCLKGSASLDGCWGSWLLIPCRGFLFFSSGCFFVWASSLLGLFIPSWFPCICYFGLSLIFFLLGLTHSFGPPSLWSFLDLNI